MTWSGIWKVESVGGMKLGKQDNPEKNPQNSLHCSPQLTPRRHRDSNSGPQKGKMSNLTAIRQDGKVRELYFFQGLIGREMRTTVRIRWSFEQMCCAMSLVCPSIATHQFWARSEPVNMPKTIESPAKCGVRVVIRFLYSEQATRNVFLRYCPYSWQCSAAYCSCNKETPEAFSMGSVWSPTIIRPNLAPFDFHLFPLMKQS